MALSFLDRDRSIAPAGYSRWLVPPAALAIHLSIGQVYAFSVFKNPLLALHAADGSTWNLKEVGYIFSIAIAFLGISAAIFGAWLEKAGPRRAMFYAALCFGAGFFVASVGVSTHQLALIYLGYGVLGGVGLGLGYISPVSTLIKWFPDRPGLATGLAIMGFGGGAMIGGPLANQLMAYFKAHSQPSIPYTMMTMGALYFAFMMFGVFTIRVPGQVWKPVGWTAPTKQSALISTHNVAVSEAWRTPQFWLLWIVLFTNVTAGIGILEQASPMIQDFFKGHVTATAAVGFVGLLSLLNMAGRFFWASTSDFIGRKSTYAIFFTLGALLFFFLPLTRAAHLNSVPSSSPSPPSSSPCTAAASPPSPPTSKTSSAASTSPPSMAVCSPLGLPPASSARSSSTASLITTSPTKCPRKRPTRSSSTSCAVSWLSASSPTSSYAQSANASGSKAQSISSPSVQPTNSFHASPAHEEQRWTTLKPPNAPRRS